MKPSDQTAERSHARLLGVCASLGAESLNVRLLRVVEGMLPDTMEMEIFDGLGELLLYDADLDTAQARRDSHGQLQPGEPDATPLGVERLQLAIPAADGLIITTPEYNHAIPGVLKNALDWASRPSTDLPLTGNAIIALVATRGRVLRHRGLSDTVRILDGKSWVPRLLFSSRARPG